MERDIAALQKIVDGCLASSPQMVKANLQFAWDRFVVHADKARCCDNGFFGGMHECQKSEGFDREPR
jgi:hypothetical protein